LPRRDALKILRADVSADQEYRQRFIREADLAAKLWHPNIVRVNDRGEFNGQLWISMDYVEGTDAARLVADRYPAGMPEHKVAEIIAAVAGGLDYAHKRGLLHRDVKPANIMLADAVIAATAIGAAGTASADSAPVGGIAATPGPFLECPAGTYQSKRTGNCVENEDIPLYFDSLQEDGITFGSLDGAVAVGRSACNELRAGTPLPQVQHDVAATTGLSDTGAADVIVDALIDLCDDVHGPVFRQALDAANP
jgi:serine/threonine protein kinase